ncbi:MAG: hypothetical protein ACFFCH_06860 [Promethearchaeota archaeon]
MKPFRKQIVLGLTMGLAIVIAINVICIFLVIPFPDLRILTVLTAIAVFGFLASLFTTDSKGIWSIFFWLGVTLLAQVLGGVLWSVFIPITDLSLLVYSPWLTFAGIGIAFLVAIPLFNFLTAYKQSKGATSPSLRT